jgi:hypothetical protein
VLATASSIMQNNVERYGTKYAIDGLVAPDYHNMFFSDTEVHPWFQLDFLEATVVKGVNITMRYVSIVLKALTQQFVPHSRNLFSNRFY